MLKRIKQFITESKERLSSQLSDFENNVFTETANIRDTFQPALQPLKFTGATATLATLLPGQLALCDTNLASITVLLATQSNLKPVPGWLAIVKRFAANNVTVTPSGMSAPGVARRINATTSKVYAAVGVYWIYFDGSDWWA